MLYLGQKYQSTLSLETNRKVGKAFFNILVNVEFFVLLSHKVKYNYQSETAFENKYDNYAFLKANLNLSLNENISTLKKQ